jgi:hypothetical protein
LFEKFGYDIHDNNFLIERNFILLGHGDNNILQDRDKLEAIRERASIALTA